MTMTRAEAARVLGMKEAEIVAVEHVADPPGGVVATTHVGTRELIMDGHFAMVLPAEPAAEEETEGEAAASEDPDAAKEKELGRVLSGSVDEVLEWVGDDSDRAAAAFVVEDRKSRPRKGLLTELQKLAAG